jgi:rRNA maturation protein Nop10
MLKRLGVEYISYHTCMDDYILYRDVYTDRERCPECGHDKYQKIKNKGKTHAPHKISRHMPIIPRI